MDFRITHEVPGRMRVGLRSRIPNADLDALNSMLCSCELIQKVTLYPRIGSIGVTYPSGDENRARIMELLLSIDARALNEARDAIDIQLVPRSNSLVMDIAVLVGSYFARRWFLPPIISTAITVWRYRRFLSDAVRSLGRSRLDVPVLDAAAIGISFVNLDSQTASQTMFLLNLGEMLEDYTRMRSENDLIYSLLDMAEPVQRVNDDVEESILPSEVEEGDLVVVRTGMPISVDGVIERGLAMVNQSALTGEPLAIERSPKDTVFAGTVVEDGEIFIRVKSNSGETKLRSIVSLVEQSESLKSETQTKMESLANKIVPWNFLLAGIVALTTRSLIKTSAALMVDYSCALKLTGSIAVLSAMSQSAKAGFTVKGAKHFESMAKADTIVFDKTGTLTEATPEVAYVYGVAKWNKREVLRLAACLEEHFPHPVARAVVNEAARQNLKHRERHAKVEYVVAHGIASSLEGKRVVIGSEHFVVEDEGVVIPASVKDRLAREADGLSRLFLAVDGELVGVLGIHDPIKQGVPEAIERLRDLGFKRVIMLTGDHHDTAARIAEQAGITEFESSMLPEHKYDYIQRLKDEGAHVVMVGDGVNDSPALSLSDVGVAMSQGTAIAKEIADITLAKGEFDSLITLRLISVELVTRMNRLYKQVIGTNSLLLAAGIGGVIQPQTSSLLHNASTIAFSLDSAKKFPTK